MEADRERRRRDTRCSFCGKAQDQVRKLVAGPAVYICDQCIQLCNEVLEEDRRAGPPPGESRAQACKTTPAGKRRSLWEQLSRRLWRAAPAYR